MADNKKNFKEKNFGYCCELSGLAITGRQLIHYIEDNGLEDAFVTVGCEGYIQDKDSGLCITATLDKATIFIRDDCVYDEAYRR